MLSVLSWVLSGPLNHKAVHRQDSSNPLSNVSGMCEIRPAQVLKAKKKKYREVSLMPVVSTPVKICLLPNMQL